MRHNPKSYWFDLVMIAPRKGDYVLVDTERGREIGLIVNPAIEVTNEQIAELKTPLKPIIRILDKNDYNRVDELAARGRDAMPVFREMVEKNNLDMRPVEVEFLFSGDKAVFYYTSETRVDFRDLVRDLAAYFHMRIDMRQIGARDEARMVGGLAHCGEVLCCSRIGGEFDSVSIRMAKEQDLSLNPAKISGACGRLMCCLRYEYEAYKEFRQRAPKKGTLIETPLGSAKVTDLDTPREVIHMQFEDGKALSVPLADLECEKDGAGCICRCRASRDVIDRCASNSILLALNALDRELDLLTDQLEIDAEAELLQVRPQTRRRRRGGGVDALSRDEAGRGGTDRAGLGTDGTNRSRADKAATIRGGASRIDRGQSGTGSGYPLLTLTTSDETSPQQQGRKLRRSSRGKTGSNAGGAQQQQARQSSSQKGSSRPAPPGQPSARQSSPGQSSSRQASPGQPLEHQSSPGQSTARQLSPGQPSSGQLSPGQSASRQPSSGQRRRRQQPKPQSQAQSQEQRQAQPQAQRQQGQEQRQARQLGQPQAQQRQQGPSQPGQEQRQAQPQAQRQQGQEQRQARQLGQEQRQQQGQVQRQMRQQGQEPREQQSPEQQQQPRRQTRPRPGQNSSSLRNPQTSALPEQQPDVDTTPGRRRRRRSGGENV